jgi:hypothetical protein
VADVELEINGKNPRASSIKVDGEQLFDVWKVEFTVDADRGMPMLILHRYFEKLTLRGEFQEVVHEAREAEEAPQQAGQQEQEPRTHDT